jgi:hypothetical protein
MKNLILILMICVSSQSMAAASGSVSDYLRDVFDIPKIESSKIFKFRRQKMISTSDIIFYKGNKIQIGEKSQHRRPSRIGNCVVLREIKYTNGSTKFQYSGRCI